MQTTPKPISPVFLTLSALYLTCLLVSNLVAGKLTAFWGVTLPAAVVLFPLAYILGDIFTEVYGFRRTKQMIWLGFSCNFLASAGYLLALALPYPDFWQNQEAYQTVLSVTPRLLLASLAGYLVGEFSNAVVLSWLKVRTQGRMLWLRTILSTLLGEAADTLLFITIAFHGTIPTKVLLQMIVAQYLFKVCYEILFTPITYWCVAAVKKVEKLDVFDKNESYRPF